MITNEDLSRIVLRQPEDMGALLSHIACDLDDGKADETDFIDGVARGVKHEEAGEVAPDFLRRLADAIETYDE